MQQEAHLGPILGVLCWDRDDVTRMDAEAKVRKVVPKDSAGRGDLTAMLSRVGAPASPVCPFPVLGSQPR